MRYYIIAGEASGDLHASNLIKELKLQDPVAEFRCWGGDLMKKEGAVLVRHYRDLAFMGFFEMVSHLPRILGNLRFCRKDIMEFKPDVLILVDYPGFNLRIAKTAAAEGLRVFYYISPQLWAWRSSRVKIIRKSVEHMFVILPFEQDFYLKYGIHADFPGHPLLDVIFSGMSLKERKDFLLENNLEDKPLIALLPGSRKMEIGKMLKVMLGVVKDFPGYQFVIAGAPSIGAEFYRSLAGNSGARIVHGQTYDLLKNSAAAVVTSGTATLETALLDVPQVVCYKGSSISYLIARQVIRVKFISLVNLIANRKVVNELIQNEFEVNALAREIKQLLKEENRKQMLEGYNDVRSALGGKGASKRAATAMVQYLRRNEVNNG